MIVVFPAPVCPTIASRSPGAARKLTSFRTQSQLPFSSLPYANHTPWNSISPRTGRSRDTGSGESTISISRSISLKILSDEAMAD